MKPEVIKKTAISYWSPEYKQFLVESPLLDGVLGVGDTEEEAHSIFDDLLADAYLAFIEGRLSTQYDKPGRPSKGRSIFSADIKPSTKTEIKKFAEDVGCTQGELIDVLLFFFKTRRLDSVRKPLQKSLVGAKRNQGKVIDAWKAAFNKELKSLNSLASSMPEIFEESR